MGAFLGQRATGNVFPGTHKAIEIIWGECLTKGAKKSKACKILGLRQLLPLDMTCLPMLVSHQVMQQLQPPILKKSNFQIYFLSKY